ncbi:MAG TPA: RNA polymerase subunit sigma-24 [Anaerolineae bacterium]|nr:RNA polymerase subunit sigma-24 [Anaerolineae bacterium]HRJ75800.1 sigma-70 family RNA polymerase sigma factor [Anaerolineales bacterium]
MNEQIAIHKLKNQDISGLEFLVMRYQVKAIRVAYLITRDSTVAEDIVQDAFIQVFHAISRFDDSRPFEPWFMRIVVNASIKAAEKSSKQINFVDEAEAFFEELISSIESTEEQIISLEKQNQIWEAMQRLSPRQRAVIVQKYFLEMSEKEMAQESGAAIGTIKWLLNSARQKLRSILSERNEK